MLQASPAYKVREELEHVLPQLREVVKAAEASVRNAQLVADEEILLDRALTALEEALS